MRHIILSLLLGVNVLACAQNATNTEAADSTNIYYQALKIYVNNLSEDNEKLLLIEKDQITTTKLPNKLGRYEIKYVNGYEIQDALKKSDELIVHRIIPLRVKNGEFFVNIIPFKVRKEKNNLQYLNSGGEGIIFRYDSSTDTFLFKEIKHGNI